MVPLSGEPTAADRQPWDCYDSPHTAPCTHGYGCGTVWFHAVESLSRDFAFGDTWMSLLVVPPPPEVRAEADLLGFSKPPNLFYPALNQGLMCQYNTFRVGKQLVGRGGLY